MGPSLARRSCLVLPGLLFVGLYAPSLDDDFVWTGGAIVAGGMILPPGRIADAWHQPRR